MKVSRKNIATTKRIVQEFLTSDPWDELHIIKRNGNFEVKVNLSSERLGNLERIMRFRP